MRAIIHHKSNAIDKILCKWKLLQEEYSNITVFQHDGWLKSSWDYIKKCENSTLYLVEIKDQDKTIGILPLYRSEKKFMNTYIRILQPIGVPFSDYLMPILSQQYSPFELIKVGIEAIFDDKENWDYIDWQDLPEDSIFDNFLKTHLKLWTSATHRERIAVCPYLPLQQGMEKIYSNMSTKLLKDVQYKERRLKREGNLQYKKVEKREDIYPTLQIFFKLHCERWEEGSEFNNEFNRERLIQAANTLFENNLLYLSQLTLNDETMAVHIGMQDHRRNYLYLHAINKNFKKYSVGSLLVYNIIKDSYQEKFEVLDFLKGDESFKGRWGAVDKFNVRYMIFNNTFKSRLSKKIHQIYYSENSSEKKRRKQIPAKIGIRISMLLFNIFNYFKRMEMQQQ